jgi:hypothetical protein
MRGLGELSEMSLLPFGDKACYILYRNSKTYLLTNKLCARLSALAPRSVLSSEEVDGTVLSALSVQSQKLSNVLNGQS